MDKSVQIITSRLHRLVESTADHFFLLLFGKAMEIHRIAGNPNGQIRIFLRILICFHQFLPIQHIYVDMMGVLGEIAV